MCIEQLIRSVGEFFKTAITCLCCLVIGGPVLITVGVIFLSSDEPRDDFKEAVNAFNPNPIEKWTGRFNTENASVRRRTLNVPGFNPIPTVYTEATLPLNKDTGNGQLTVAVNINTVQPFTRKTPLQVLQEKWYTCSSSQCSGSSGKCDCQRKQDEFRNKCISEGGQYTTESSQCRLGEKCGYCKQNVYLATLYLVAGSVGGGMYRESDKYQSALYPFYDISQGYEPRQPSSVNVRLYSEGDPFIALQRLTEGREEFGIPNRTVGILCIVLGSLFTLLEIFVCVAVVCFCMRRKKGSANQNAHPTEGNDSVTPYGYQQSQPMQPPHNYAYGQPPPQHGYAYGQPPPPGAAYGQPPPPGSSYGKPLPGAVYGQPPPPGTAYGQPPPPGSAYGQPPLPGAAYGQPPPPQQGYTYGQPPQGAFSQGNVYDGTVVPQKPK